MHVNTCTALAANSVFHPQRTWVVRMDQQIVLSADLLHMLHRPQSRWRKKNDGRWRSLAVKSLFLADGATPNSIAIFGK